MGAAYRVFDIETVVDRRFWTSPPQKFRLEAMPAPPSGIIQVPGKGPMMAAPGPGQMAMSLVPDEPFPPPQAHRVVSISWVELSGDDGEFYALTDTNRLCAWSHDEARADATEAELLRAFCSAQENDDATLVTWNGRSFDLPVINLRSFLHGISCEWYYKERDLRYRYTEASHCDLMDVFTDYGAARAIKLDDVAKLAGLPGKVGPVHGSNVADFYNRGDEDADMQKVGDYCLADSLQTALLFAKHRVHKGMISHDHYKNVVLPSFAPHLEKSLGIDVGKLR